MAGWLPPAPRAVLFPLINCSHSDKLIREQPVTWWSPGLALYVNTECQQCDQVYPFLFWFRSYLVSQHDGTLIILRVEHSCGRSVAGHTWDCEGTQDTSHIAHYQTVRGHKSQVILLITSRHLLSRAGNKYASSDQERRTENPLSSTLQTYRKTERRMKIFICN